MQICSSLSAQNNCVLERFHMNPIAQVINTFAALYFSLYEQSAVALLQRGEGEEFGSNEWQRKIKYLSATAVER